MRLLLRPLALVLCCLPTFAVTLTGTLTGPDGKPVASATVWLYRQQFQPAYTTVPVTTTRTTADGTFALEDAFDTTQAKAQWEMFAHAPGFPVLPHRVYPADKPQDLKLAAPITRQVTVTGPGDTFLPGIRLIPLAFSSVAQSRWSPYWIPKDVAQVAAVTTDATGQAPLLMPTGTARAMLEVSGADYATAEVTLAVTPAVLRLSLQPAGSVRARIVGPQDAALAGLEVKLELQDRSQGKSRFSQSCQLTTDATGGLSAAGLTPGQWSLTIPKPPEGDFWLAGRAFEVKPGAEMTVEIKPTPTVPVRGRIVDSLTGQPVADLTVTCRAGTTKTDADGRFVVRGLPGQGQLQFSPYDRLVGSTPFHNLMVPPEGLDVGDIKVSVARQLTVLVTDEQGKTPQYARVRAEQTQTQPYAHHVEASADAEGRCVLKGLYGHEATIRALAGDLASEPITVRVDDQREPLKLVVKPGLLAVVKVRVTYADGTPCAGQYVNFNTSRANPQFSTGSGATTNAEGLAEQRAIEPGLTCRYTVSAPACPTVSTDEWVAVAGETHDFGTLVLRPEQGFVTGVVVDEAGQAVSGAMLFNGTDGPRTVKIESDEQGHFRVEGLYAGEAFIFARAEGYRVNAVCVPVGSDNVKIVLQHVRSGTLGAPLPLAEPPLAAEAARPLARQVLLEALTRPGASQGNDRRRLLTLLARLDGTEALKLAGTGVHADWVRMEVARVTLPQDVTQGLAVLQDLPTPELRVDVLLDVAEANRQQHPELGQRCLQEARTAFPQIVEVRRRALQAARVGAALLPSDAATGKAILLAARDEIVAATSDSYSNERALVAAYLAEVDLPAALAMLNMKDLSIYTTIARHVAGKRPDEALALLDAWGSAWDKTRAATRLAPFLPPERFAQTREMLLRVSRWDTGPTLVRMCLAAPRERLPEWIEEVRDLLEPPPPEQRGDGLQSSGEREVQGLAVLALMARRVGYQGAREIMLRAVLARMRSWSWPGGGRITLRGEGQPRMDRTRLELAQVVALMEPQLARRLVPPDVAPDDRDMVLYAGTLAGTEPLRAVKLLKGLPAGPGEAGRTFEQASADVAEALMLSPEERETLLLQRDRDWACLPRPDEMATLAGW